MLQLDVINTYAPVHSLAFIFRTIARVRIPTWRRNSSLVKGVRFASPRGDISLEKLHARSS